MNRSFASVVALTAAFVLALIFYFVLIGRAAFSLIADGRVVPVVLGIAILILPLLGVWMIVATLRAGFAHQHLARRAREEGRELDVSDLPRMPSGRIQRGAADADVRAGQGGVGNRSRQLAQLVSARPCLRLRGRPIPGPRDDAPRGAP